MQEVGGSIPPGSTTLRPSGYAWRSRAQPEGRSVPGIDGPPGDTMWYVYIIRSIDFPEQEYIGATADLKRRLLEHNAGKSTFLAAVSAAKPKIADYPFTTLHPQLGVVRVDEREFVLADLPGLIEGAHEGTGLGDRFLGHTERCRVLLHLIDGTSEDAGAAYKTVRAELEAYGHGLTEKPEIVALTKVDALTPDVIKSQTAKLEKAAKKTPLTLSSQSRQGVQEALRALWKFINAAREEADTGQLKETAWQP